MTKFKVEDGLSYLLCHAEAAVQIRSGRLPANRPLLVYPNGKVRIEFLGTFPSIPDAAQKVMEILWEGKS